ncbi:TMS membrane protein/tumour differentially expressed family protein [Dictyostelium discoideum AX4]|uniref:Probable serine incorporator n=1 Tax=Dictyostelium discoideum TaxID=44689 RepID=SERIC_DICDI|nr:TMS membrane protein/tumour differentially expressed family protein [Dictyostelium discoideum AX4]Q54UF8.1 RecName: Full=Probable serine incorporator [Dictyostelium discoideum]EAL66846.1 TMS membrane protein/tumour differentially expressed family protein [Dictyostelium discoideum AX4]|eukprot:XP_640818.1 TMS membrane protein/tumour differentially expressed family protein [Dictyostelium discoideum AX4]
MQSFMTGAPGHHIQSIKKSTSTRLVYVVFFLLVSIVAYILSYWTFSWFNNLDVLKICSKGDNECKGALVVYRLTFGLALYHILLGLVMINVKSAGDSRAKLQDGYWPLKILLLGVLIFVSFFIPNSFFRVYTWISIFSAAIFIFIQLVLLIECAYSLNESCVRKIEDEGHSGKKWYVLLCVLSFGSIALAVAGTVLMLVFYGRGSCSINQFYIVFNLGICLIVGVLSISEKVREYRPSSGLFQSGVVMLYCTYLIYSAINSEPPGTCSSNNTSSPKESTIIIGAVFTIISVCYSAFRSSDSTELLGNHNHYSSIPTDPNAETTGVADDECECTAYNYSFFHFTFACGAMYLSALLTNWATMTSTDITSSSTSSSNSTISVDSGMVSVWVKVVSSWVVVLLYLWTLIGPILLRNRVWD